MEILRIGKYAIKISLSDREAKEYKLSNIDSCDETEAKEAFSKLLADAKEISDFSYVGRKIFTEIYPCKDGGCEVFVSTTSSDSKSKEQIKIKSPNFQTTIYEFNSLNDVMKVCYRLNEIKFKGKSSMYYNVSTEHYYLSLDNMFSKDLKYAFLLEYGKMLKSSSCLYISEHYKCICKSNAVKQIAHLSN